MDEPDFLARLEFVLDGRKRTPWGAALGLNKGTMGRIGKGHIPGPDLLIPIGRAERVSLSWLIDGAGAPFLITREETDSAMATLLDALFDESWRITLCTDGARVVVVLTQPGQIEVNGEMRDYIITEVLVGPCGRKVLLTLDRHASECRLLHLPAAELSRLSAGLMGNRALHEQIAQAEVVPINQLGELCADADESSLLGQLRRMNTRQRETLQAFLESIADEGTTEPPPFAVTEGHEQRRVRTPSFRRQARPKKAG